MPMPGLLVTPRCEAVLCLCLLQKLTFIPLPIDTVALQIGDTAEDVQHQFFRKLHDKLLSTQLDEATDRYKDVHFITCVQFCNAFAEEAEKDSVTEDISRHPNWKLVNDVKCGLNQKDRIIGGFDATLGQYPWIVRLAFVKSDDYSDMTMKCGGAIINNKYILTAGHCFREGEKVAFVRVGELDEYTNPDCNEDECAPPYVDYQIEDILRHPLYSDPIPFANDITLIRIKEQIEFNDFVAPICLEYGSLMNRDYTSEQVEVAGWGIQDLDLGYPATMLQFATMPVVSNKVCHNALKSKTTITEKQICAGGIKGIDSCGGDSGGPLMKAASVDNQSPRYFLLGIVSFGTKRCAKTTLPAVYTRVSKYLPWILDHILP
ncbi:spaetzle-processing enzyme-like [Lycorma delicatula]|uniref:spaetzle-processing enzyme-like n=1 Tax=Lycorma delicatula TaxID=130591 RepID=UPI003F5186BF